MARRFGGDNCYRGSKRSSGRGDSGNDGNAGNVGDISLGRPIFARFFLVYCIQFIKFLYTGRVLTLINP